MIKKVWDRLYVRSDSAIHWLAIFSTFVKLAVDRYNLRLRFGIYKLKFLRSIVGFISVVSQLFGQFYEGCIIHYLVDSLSGLRTTGPRTVLSWIMKRLDKKLDGFNLVEIDEFKKYLRYSNYSNNRAEK